VPLLRQGDQGRLTPEDVFLELPQVIQMPAELGEAEVVRFAGPLPVALQPTVRRHSLGILVQFTHIANRAVSIDGAEVIRIVSEDKGVQHDHDLL
jgi:hypothetical protein